MVKGCKTDSRGTVVQGNHKSYRMSAPSSDDRSHWVSVINESIREHPFHDIVTAKKAALRRKQALANNNPGGDDTVSIIGRLCCNQNKGG